MIAIITKLVSNDNNNNSFKLPLYYIFLEDTKYMTILTRQERERLVLELHNRGKTYREISKEARISPRDIGVILNKVMEEKKERLKEEQDNDDADKNKSQEQQHLSLSTQAYKLFSDRKTPLELTTALNLRESEATKFYKEYWKLRQLHNLNMIYEETKGDIESFLKLHKLAKKQGMSREQIVKLLQLADEDKRKTEDIIKFKNKINII